MPGTDNRSNRIIYRRWAGFYDKLFGSFLAAARRRALTLAEICPGEHVLLPGVGTGLDLPFLPSETVAVGIDLSPAMLGQACGRSRLPRRCQLVLGDAQRLPFPDATFDVALCSLVLSVVPDGATCLRETLRVLRPEGRLVIFDKFLPDRQTAPSLPRRLLNWMTVRLGTDINRRFNDLAAGMDWIVQHDEPVLFGGAYRILRLQHAP